MNEGPIPMAGQSENQPEKPAAVKKEPREKKARAPRAKKEGVVSRPRLPKYGDEQVITILKENAKSRTAAERFSKYRNGMTVKEYVDTITSTFPRSVGQTQADLRWDIAHEFISIA